MRFSVRWAILSLATSALTSPTSIRDDGADPQVARNTLTNTISIVRDQAKVARERELLVRFIKKVQMNEPGVLQFDLFLSVNTSQFSTYERYANSTVREDHLKTSWLAELQTAEKKEQLKRAENMVLFIEPVYGFDRSG